MVRKYTLNAYQPTQKKRHVNTLSMGEKSDFITQALDTSDGRCIGIAKTQHRRCRNPVRHFQWEATLQEIITAAEDHNLHEEDLEDDAVKWAKRMSCHLHTTQPGSPFALLKAIKVYRQTFAVNEPASSRFTHLPSSFQNTVSYDAQSDQDAYFEAAPAPGRSVKLEQRTDAQEQTTNTLLQTTNTLEQTTNTLRQTMSALERTTNALEVAMTRISVLEARLNAKSNTSKMGLLDQFALFLQQQNSVAGDRTIE